MIWQDGMKCNKWRSSLQIRNQRTVNVSYEVCIVCKWHWLIGNNAGVIGSDVPWLECPACNALTWVITVTE